jgi:acetoacetyl-CoA synthetase
VWAPTADAVRDAELTRFADGVGVDCHSYDRLHRWSVGDLEGFWSQFTTFAGIVGDLGGPVLVRDAGAPMTSARFFPDAQLNFAENLLVGEVDHVAVVEADEAGIKRTLSRGELRQEVARVQRGLLRLGLRAGDRVASVLPNTAESLVALLAATAVGAVWSTCAPEFGLAGMRDRFGQTAPRLLIGASSYLYNGATHSLTDRLARLTHELDAVEWLVMTGRDADVAAACPVHRLADLGDDTAAEPTFPRLPFDHPLYINFTSGTTGLPKCIVHRAGGVLLQHRKEHALHCDIKTGDRVFYYSNTGWMMYHWLVSALASGAALVLYDGAAIPRGGDGGRDHGVLWRLAEDVGVTHFGTSPKYLSILQRDGYDVRGRHRLDSLRMIMSTGCTKRSRTTCVSRPSPGGRRSSDASSWATQPHRSAPARYSAKRWAWRCTSWTSATARSSDARGTWFAQSPFRRCRWGSGERAAGSATSASTSLTAERSGPTATTLSGARAAAS